jgi:hypothetical protein
VLQQVVRRNALLETAPETSIRRHVLLPPESFPPSATIHGSASSVPSFTTKAPKGAPAFAFAFFLLLALMLEGDMLLFLLLDIPKGLQPRTEKLKT